jgi:hypothetical protein
MDDWHPSLSVTVVDVSVRRATIVPAARKYYSGENEGGGK